MVAKERRSKTYLLANWKMNPSTANEAVKMFDAIKKVASKATKVQTVICPPSLYIETLKKHVTGHRLVLGGQNCHWENSGAHTGSISPTQLLSSGAKYVILGHSDRRALGETDEQINMKVKSALSAGLVVILCIGEQERDAMGEFLKVVRTQLEKALSTIPRRYFLNLYVTYEPVWAISSNNKTKKMMTPEEMFEMSIFVKKILAGICGQDLATKIPVIYGGSANDKNVKDYLDRGGVDGFLVGKASLTPATFNEMITLAGESVQS